MGYSPSDLFSLQQGVQDLVAAESLVEEYWADPDTGVKKWKKLRPKLDNMKQQMEMLKSQDQMSKANNYQDCRSAATTSNREVEGTSVQKITSKGNQDHRRISRRVGCKSDKI